MLFILKVLMSIGVSYVMTWTFFLFTELFSVPILTMSPAEVFQKDYMTLTCKSESFASEKLRREELIYSLDPSENALSENKVGEFSGRALLHDLNYTCIARAKGIVKHSNTLTVRPKGELACLFQMQNVRNRLTVDSSSSVSNLTCWPHISYKIICLVNHKTLLTSQL